MVDGHTRRSPRFKALWTQRNVRHADTDTLEAIHPRGRLTFTMVMWQAVAVGVRFSAYIPADAATASVLRTPTQRADSRHNLTGNYT